MSCFSLLTFLCLALCFANIASYHAVVDELVQYINSNATFDALLNATFEEAHSSATYADMYNFFDAYITIIGNYSNGTFVKTLDTFCSTKTGSQLYVERKSQAWMMKYFMAKKAYADSFNSTDSVSTWMQWYKINMTEYVIPSGGFQSFNDFFTRQLKPGMRPIAEPSNASVIISPCDGQIDGITYDLQMEHTLNIKNQRYNLSQMLNFDEHFVRKFEGGTAIEILLYQYNYHRYHSAVNGYINALQLINGYILVDAQWVNDTIPYFLPNYNVRGIMYVDTVDFGYVAQIHVGVEYTNSVNFDVSPGMFVHKGNEVGYFKYGGSTVVLLFEKDVIPRDDIDVHFGDYVQMGQQIAVAQPKRSDFDKKMDL